jgi:hypothetical protein
VPASVPKPIYENKYAKSPAPTELLELPGRAHLVTAGEGREDVAAKTHFSIEAVYVTQQARERAAVS